MKPKRWLAFLGVLTCLVGFAQWQSRSVAGWQVGLLPYWASKMAPLPFSVGPIDVQTPMAQSFGDYDLAAPTRMLKADDPYDLSAHQTLSRVMLLIRDNYVEPERIKPMEMFLAAMDYIQKTVPEVMVDETGLPQTICVLVGDKQQSFVVNHVQQIWEVSMLLRDVFRFVEQHIKDAVVRRDIEYAAINGMLSTLDPHSVLLKPENFDEVKLSTRGEFGGLGIVISIRDGGLTVISPIEGTPASQAGIKAKDKIIKIGEESTVNMALDEAVQKLRGKPGSKINITVARKNMPEPKVFTLARALIKIESISSKLLDHSIGYVKIKSFQGNTFADLENSLAMLKVKNQNKELKGLVLDLRNNPGGLLDQAILVSDRFIRQGPLVITVGEGSRKRDVKMAQDAGIEEKYPVVILLNGGSASASEIVAGALKNHNRAVVMGQQSFGKGSVQVLYDFKDRSALKLTIAQYLTPGDISIQSVGITPDVQIAPAVIEKNNVHLFVDDDAPREKNLEKHLSQHGATSVVIPSKIKITHLMPPDSDTETQVGEEDLHLSNNANDFEIQLAHDVLTHATGIRRQDVLQSAMPLFTLRAEQEEAVIASRMAQLGVDWSMPLPLEIEPKTAATVRLQLLGSKTTHAANNKAVAWAGDTMVLRATVHNLGDTPLYRVYGVATSGNPLLSNLEFIFGKIPPHEQRIWDVNVKIPVDTAARADEISLALNTQRGPSHTAVGNLVLQIQEPARPALAARYAINDKSGNRDGLPQSKETVDLRLDVINHGTALAKNVTVMVKNLSGKKVFLEQGRYKIGDLAPKQSKVAHLRFSLPASDKSPNKEPLQLRLAIWDVDFTSMVSELLTLPQGPTAKFTNSQARLQAQKKAPLPVYAGANANMPILGYLPAEQQIAASKVGGQFYQVATVDRLLDVGFVQKADVMPVVDRSAKPLETKLQPHYPIMAPDITFASHPIADCTKGYSLTVAIKSSAPLKDVFLFVNDKKVFYQATPKAAVQAGKNDGYQGLYHYPLAIPLHLKSGSNAVVMIARQSDELMGRKMLGVYCEHQAVVSQPTGQTASTSP